jgi:DoxX-like family
MTTIFYIVVLVVIGVVYGAAGAQKIFGAKQMVERMQGMGYGTMWRRLIGATEVLGVAALFVAQLRALSLVLLLPYAIGGLAVHMSHHHSFIERDLPAVAMMVLIPVALYLDPNFSIHWY